MITKNPFHTALAALLALAISGCASDGSSSRDSSTVDAAGAKTLHDRLGGEPAITAVVDDFVGRGAANAKVNFTRKGTAREWQATPESVARLKKLLVQFIGKATGGPQKYEGRDMKAIHAGMKITNAEFNALAGDLRASLDKFNVPAREQGELLAIVETTRKDIVE